MTQPIHSIVVSDIFGRTGALEHFCADLGFVTQIVDPYQGSDMAFANESEAYQYFISEVGLPRYTQLLQSALSRNNNATRLIGFSVGAAAIWQNSHRLKDIGIQQAVCFYGSQIRHATDIEPDINLTVVMPQTEAHFCVDKLSAQLVSKPSVQVLPSGYMHGFMNKLSNNFSPDAYHFYLNWLKTRFALG
ncbi:dienelactone hydrolase family protein [Neptunicella sp. SCSIO 80796]|uniref:dienelactone hydrolase family protein n=1 Tax=Neptunicella plasticusilytica TaxID=3117012 RepID=UPI003A4D48EA